MANFGSNYKHHHNLKTTVFTVDVTVERSFSVDYFHREDLKNPYRHGKEMEEDMFASQTFSS